MKKVLLLKAGEAALPIRQSVGDYDVWFRQAFARSQVDVDLKVVSPFLGALLPDAGEYDLLVMTGSPLSATQPTDWMRHASDYLRQAIESRIPVLGVCFGHQLLGLAYGSPVVPNPLGREIGTVDIDVSSAGRADRLFHGIPDQFRAQTTHQDIVQAAPAAATILARNATSEVQAMGVGAYGRGVQFHPELSAEGMRAVVHSRMDVLEQEWSARGGVGLGVPTLLAGIGPSPHAIQILSNFVRLFERG